MAHFFGLSPIEYTLAKIALVLFWLVGVVIVSFLQHFTAVESVWPKPFGTKRQRLHFWLILLLGGFYLFLIPFLRMKPDPKESAGYTSPT